MDEQQVAAIAFRVGMVAEQRVAQDLKDPRMTYAETTARAREAVEEAVRGELSAQQRMV